MMLAFKNYHRSEKVPFLVYADFECYIKLMQSCDPNPGSSYTKQYQKHEPSSFCYYIKCFDDEATIVRMEWPARSPDLNPIEHAWDMLQTAVSSRPVPPASVQELRQALLYCDDYEGVKIELPKKGMMLAFKNYHISEKVPFLVYADFECCIKLMQSCDPNPGSSYTKQYQKHEPSSFCYYIKCFDDEVY